MVALTCCLEPCCAGERGQNVAFWETSQSVLNSCVRRMQSPSEMAQLLGKYLCEIVIWDDFTAFKKCQSCRRYFVFRSHSQHLVTNGVHKQYLFENISLHWIITKYFKLQKKSIFILLNHSGNFFGRHFFKNFWASGIFYTSKNLVFGFTSS